jgi:hypothetical protein
MWCVVQSVVIEAHERLFLLFVDGRCVVLVVKLAVVVLDISRPFVGDVGLELGRLDRAWSFLNVDAGAQGQLVGVISFRDGWRDEVREGVFVNVWKMVFLRVLVTGLNPWRERVGTRGVSQIGRHDYEEILELSKE